MADDLRRRAVRAIGASSLGGWFAKLISLLSTLVLVRLLTPEDFGLMAIATTAAGFIGFFNEVGMGAAIVQRKELRDEEINGCFGIAVLASAVLCGIAAVASWPVASFFDMPRLQPVLATLGLGFFFGALDTIPISLLRRQLRMQEVMWVGVAGAVMQSIVAIPLAYLGFGYWALVAAFFVGQTVTLVWLWIVADWRPTWPMRLRDGAGLLNYGLGVTYTRLMWHLYMNVDKLVVGKLLGAQSVGVYDVSRSLASLPTSQITGLVTSVAAPVFARVQTDAARLGAVLLRLTGGLTYLVAPLLLGIAVTAPELVSVLLGPQWTAAVLPMQALCISELVAATVNNLQAQLLISTGHVQRLVRFTTLCAVVMPLALAVGAWQAGLLGVALAWACVYPLLNVLLAREALRICGLTPGQLWRAVRQPLLGALLMVACVQAGRIALHALNLPDLAVLVGSVAIGALVYVSYLVMVDRGGLAEVRQVLIDFGVPSRHLDRWPFNRGVDPNPC
jgi:O-antigen/teichoic acid export membrane protein